MRSTVDETSRSLLPMSPRPWPGESARGYVRRLASENGYLSIGEFCRMVGLAPTFGLVLHTRRWPRLTTLTGQRDDALDHLRWTRHSSVSGSVYVQAMGTILEVSLLVSDRVRFCPDCLRSRSTLRNLWSIRQVVACPIHRTRLVEVCPGCGDPYNFSSGGPWTCKCQWEMHLADTYMADDNCVESARLVASLLPGNGSLPVDRVPPPETVFEELSFGSLNDYLVTIRTLGVAATFPSHMDRHLENAAIATNRPNSSSAMLSAASSDLDALSRQVSAATEVLKDWPSTFFGLMNNARGRNPSPPESTAPREAFATDVGNALLFPPRGLDGLPIRRMAKAVDEYCRGVFGRAWRTRNFVTRQVTARRLFRRMTVEGLSQATEGTFYPAAVRRWLLDALDNLDEAELGLGNGALCEALTCRIVELRDRASEALSVRDVKYLLDGADHTRTLRPWSDACGLIPDREISLLRGRPYYDKSRVDLVRFRLSEVAKPIEGNIGLTPFHPDGFRLLGLSKGLTKADLIRSVLIGSIAVYSSDDLPNLSTLFFDLEARRRFQREKFEAERVASEYVSYYQLRRILAAEFGSEQIINTAGFREMHASGLVRVQWKCDNRAEGSKRVVDKYHTNDVLNYIRSRPV